MIPNNPFLSPDVATAQAQPAPAAPSENVAAFEAELFAANPHLAASPPGAVTPQPAEPVAPENLQSHVEIAGLTTTAPPGYGLDAGDPWLKVTSEAAAKHGVSQTAWNGLAAIAAEFQTSETNDGWNETLVDSCIIAGYRVAIPDGQVDAGNPYLRRAANLAREHGLSQEAFSGLLEAYAAGEEIAFGETP